MATLRLVHPRGQEPPRPPRGRRSGVFALTAEESRHLRAAVKNTARAYGGMPVLASVTGVPLGMPPPVFQGPPGGGEGAHLGDRACGGQRGPTPDVAGWRQDADRDGEAPRASQHAGVLAAGKGLVLAVRAMLGARVRALLRVAVGGSVRPLALRSARRPRVRAGEGRRDASGGGW